MGYIGFNYGIYFVIKLAIYLNNCMYILSKIMVYIGQKLWDILAKSIGYIRKNMRYNWQ